MFADRYLLSQLSCKLEREFRCVELAELMTQSVVTLAIRYASRTRRMALAQRLNEIALEKASQLQEEEPDEEPQYASSRRAPAGFFGNPPSHRQSQEAEPMDEPEEQEDEEEMEKDEAAEAPKRLFGFFF